MTNQTQLSLDWHRPLEAAIGIVLIVLPVVLDFPIGGFVLSAGPGALIVALALGVTREGRAISGTTHRVLDLALLAVLIVAALVCAALLAPIGPAIEIGAAAVAEGVLIAATRYVESPTRRDRTFTAGTRAGRTT